MSDEVFSDTERASIVESMMATRGLRRSDNRNDPALEQRRACCLALVLCARWALSATTPPPPGGSPR